MTEIHEPHRRVAVGLYCQACESEGVGESDENSTHDVTGYAMPDPWRLVTVDDRRYRTARHYLACSPECEAVIRGAR